MGHLISAVLLLWLLIWFIPLLGETLGGGREKRRRDGRRSDLLRKAESGFAESDGEVEQPTDAAEEDAE